MKILHITNSYSEGGVESFLLTLLPSLKEKGHDVELLVLNKDDTLLVPTLTKHGITVHIGGYSSSHNILNIFVIRRLFSNYDIIHTHLFPTQYFAVIARLLSRSKTLLITTEHTTYNKRRNIKITRKLESWIYDKYSKIICVSKKAEENLIEWTQLAEKKIHTIYNGIDLKKYQDVNPYTREELGLPEKSKIVIMVARFFEQKDHATLIKAISHLPTDIFLLFCGSGADCMDKARSLAKDLQVDKRVKFLGNRKDIPQLLKSVDIAVLSTFYEGFPISILEYMAAGKPVIASNVDGVREMIINAGILFEVQDDIELAKEIGRLFENEDYLEEITKNCRLRALQFSEHKMVEGYNVLYEGLIKQRK